MLDRLRAAPPQTIAGLPVTSFEDLRDEDGRLGPLKGATDAASRNFLIFRCGELAKVVLRPSGTEPKAKIYLELCTLPCKSGTSAAEWQRQCHETDDLTQRMAKEFVRDSLALIGLDPSSAGAQ
jgi:phosphoglucomutase